MDTEIISKEQQDAIKAKSNELTEMASGIVIKTQMDNEKATALLVNIRTERKNREEIFKPAVSKAKSAYDEVRALRDTAIKPLQEAEDIIKGKGSDFVIAENSRREALQKKADDKFAKAVEKAETTGKALTAAPTVISKVTGAAGASYSISWSAEITDLMALVKAVAAGAAPLEALNANLPVLNKLAQVSKEGLSIPGVKPVKKVVTRAA